MQEADPHPYEDCLAYWQSRASHLLSEEDAREISDNLAGLFETLAEWTSATRCQDSDQVMA
jgi:hypothetical protein